MLIQGAAQVFKRGVAVDQIVERGIAGITGIAVLLCPGAAGFVALGQRAAGLFEFNNQRVIIERSLIKASDEKRFDSHTDRNAHVIAMTQ